MYIDSEIWFVATTDGDRTLNGHNGGLEKDSIRRHKTCGQGIVLYSTQDPYVSNFEVRDYEDLITFCRLSRYCFRVVIPSTKSPFGSNDTFVDPVDGRGRGYCSRESRKRQTGLNGEDPPKDTDCEVDEESKYGLKVLYRHKQLNK